MASVESTDGTSCKGDRVSGDCADMDVATEATNESVNSDECSM